MQRLWIWMVVVFGLSICACGQKPNPDPTTDTGLVDDGGADGGCTAGEETCDGVDNDCDGKIDEGLVKQCPATRGVCQGGEVACQDGAFPECGQAGAYGEAWESEESSCDQKDNDCDGTTDEGCECVFGDTEAGVCATATRGPDGRCIEPDGYESTESSCDDKDNDCDGVVDEEVRGECPLQKGVCKGATTKCLDGGTLAQCASRQYGEDYEPEESRCDDADNDCDGLVDEGCPCVYKSKDVGVCKKGQMTGDGLCGKPAAWEASETICDDADNDCDGLVDESCPYLRKIGRNSQAFVSSKAVGAFPDGAVVVGGYYRGELFGRRIPGFHWAAYVAKYDPAGQRQWMANVIDSEYLSIQDVAVGPSGSVYAIGEAEDSVRRKPYAGGPSDIFVVKFGAGGTEKWFRMIGSAREDTPAGIAVNSQGDVYAYGTVKGPTVDGRPRSSGASDSLLVHYDSSGNRKRFIMPGGPFDVRGGDIAIDGNDDIYIVGIMSRAGSKQPHGARDVWIRKLGPDLGRVWDKFVGTPRSEFDPVVAVGHSAKYFYVSGSTFGDLGRLSGGPRSTGRYDVFTGKFRTSDATTQWVTRVGSMEEDRGQDLAVAPSGSVYVTGKTQGDLAGHQLQNAKDAFLVRFDGAGKRQRTRALGKAMNPDPRRVAVDAHDQVYIVGRVQRTVHLERLQP